MTLFKESQHKRVFLPVIFLTSTSGVRYSRDVGSKWQTTKPRVIYGGDKGLLNDD